MRPIFRTLSVATLPALLLLAGIASAQERDRDQPADPARRAGQPGQAERRQPGAAQPGAEGRAAGEHRADAQLAACLIIDNHKEISLGKFAQQKSQNEEVKSFAQKMIRDHEQFVQQLQETATRGGYSAQELALGGAAQAERPGQPGARLPDATAPRTQDPAAPRRTARPAELDDGGLDFIGVKQEVAEQCLQTIQQELAKKPEAEFDQCYIGAQVMAHMAMLDTLKVFAKHASPELRSVIEKGQQTTQMHLDEAKKLEQQLSKADAGTARERTNP